MKKHLAFAVAIALLTSCSSKEEKTAESLYQQAQTAYEQQNYNRAITLLDSIENSCKKAIEWRKAGHTFSYEVQLAQQKDSLETADTMLIAVNKLINEMVEKNNFIYEKGEFDELGRFYIKGTDTQSNLERSYIHATVNDYGVVHLISEYRGGAYINHTRLRLTGSDKTEVLTASIPLENDGANFHFKNQGLCHETVTYVNDPALGFIDMQVSDKKLKAELLYKDEQKAFSVAMNDNDRVCIAQTYQLGQMLAAQLKFSQQSKVAAGKIQFLQTKIRK